jgi:hypothetical protein
VHWVRPYSGEGLSDEKSKGLNNELGSGVGARLPVVSSRSAVSRCGLAPWRA